MLSGCWFITFKKHNMSLDFACFVGRRDLATVYLCDGVWCLIVC